MGLGGWLFVPAVRHGAVGRSLFGRHGQPGDAVSLPACRADLWMDGCIPCLARVSFLATRGVLGIHSRAIWITIQTPKQNAENDWPVVVTTVGDLHRGLSAVVCRLACRGAGATTTRDGTGRRERGGSRAQK